MNADQYITNVNNELADETCSGCGQKLRDKFLMLPIHWLAVNQTYTLRPAFTKEDADCYICFARTEKAIEAIKNKLTE
jgi:hypothetical protein